MKHDLNCFTIIALTYVSTHCHISRGGIRYNTTKHSNRHHYITVEPVQVNCSIINTSASVERCSSTLYWNCSPIGEEPLSSSVWWSPTTWHPVSNALECIVWIWRWWDWSISLINLSDQKVTIVRVDHSLQREVNTCIIDTDSSTYNSFGVHKKTVQPSTSRWAVTLVDADAELGVGTRREQEILLDLAM